MREAVSKRHSRCTSRGRRVRQCRWNLSNKTRKQSFLFLGWLSGDPRPVATCPLSLQHTPESLAKKRFPSTRFL